MNDIEQIAAAIFDEICMAQPMQEVSVSNWSKIVTQEAPHCRIVGPSGSGKSVLAQAIASHTPGKLFIIDPVWEPGHWGGLPAVTVDADGNYGKIEQALRALLVEMKNRAAKLQNGENPGEELTIIFDEVPDTIAELPQIGGLFIRRMAQRGRHSNMRLVGIGQSSRVESWGIGGFGDVAESFTTIFLGDKAIEQMPELAGQERAGVLEWRGRKYPIDLTGVMELAQKPIDQSRIFRLPAVPASTQMSRMEYIPFYIQLRERLRKVMDEPEAESAQQ